MERQYIKYYLQQTGGGFTEVGPVWHSPVNFQRGRGIGNIFGGLMKYLQPVLSSGLNFLKNQIVSSGAAALSDVAAGGNIKEVLQEQGKTVLRNLRKKAVNELHSMYGSGIHPRKGTKRKATSRVRNKTIKRKKKTNKVHSSAKRKRRTSKNQTKRKSKRTLDIFN